MNQQPDKRQIEQELLVAGFSDVQVHSFSQLESTSVWLREKYMSGETSPESFTKHLCVTDWQTAGIARRGRTWQTKPGNVTFSILSSTETAANDLLGLSLVTGIGVADCLKRNADIQVQLKWPNDVLVNNTKLGGLLTEINNQKNPDRQSGVNQVLTGIGINFLHDSDVLNLGIGATSLENEGVIPDIQQRDSLVGKLAASVFGAHEQFFELGWGAFSERWESLDWLFNKEVMIHSQQSTEQGIARGVNEHGALLIERSGTTYPVYGGNVSIRPTA